MGGKGSRYLPQPLPHRGCLATYLEPPTLPIDLAIFGLKKIFEGKRIKANQLQFVFRVM
jgi:hypothetical protein